MSIENDIREYKEMLDKIDGLSDDTKESLVLDFTNKKNVNINTFKVVIGDYSIDVSFNIKDKMFIANYITITQISDIGYTYKDNKILTEEMLINLIKDNYNIDKVKIEDRVKRYINKKNQ